MEPKSQEDIDAENAAEAYLKENHPNLIHQLRLALSNLEKLTDRVTFLTNLILSAQTSGSQLFGPDNQPLPPADESAAFKKLDEQLSILMLQPSLLKTLKDGLKKAAASCHESEVTFHQGLTKRRNNRQ